MPNENVVVKIGMDKPFFLLASSIIWEVCLPLFSLASVSHGQLEAVLCDKGSSCPEDVNVMNRWTVDLAPPRLTLSPPTAGKTCV